MDDFMKPLIANAHKILLPILLLGSLASCYRMPTDDDYSLVPTTNNPSVTCAKENNLMLKAINNR